MTTLTPGRAVARQTAATYRGRPLCVTLHPSHMVIRQKGTRTKYLLDYQAAFQFAAKLEANRIRAERLMAHYKLPTERRKVK